MRHPKLAAVTHTKNSSTAIKPFSDAEIVARQHGRAYLALARSYRERGDNESALNCCAMGLRILFGISRPLAVRDQLHEMARQIDATWVLT
jgi:hypothetical protein